MPVMRKPGPGSSTNAGILKIRSGMIGLADVPRARRNRSQGHRSTTEDQGMDRQPSVPGAFTMA